MREILCSGLRTGVLVTTMVLAPIAPAQCGPEGWLEEFWYGVTGGSCSYGTPEAAFYPSFPQCDGRSEILLFDDEFSGTDLDSRAWRIQPWGQAYLTTDDVQEYNSLDNIVVQDGTCHVIARRENVTRRAIGYLGDEVILGDGLPNLRSFDFTSSNIWSSFRFGQGTYEIRFRVDVQPGMFPAFWIFSSIDNIWNEIDWFELVGHEPNSWLGTLHHDSEGNGCNNFCAEKVENIADFNQWHVIKGVYDFDHISWYLDGLLLHKKTRYVTAGGNMVECGENVSNQILFQRPYWPNYGGYIIFNMAVFRGDNAPLPEFESADFEIDYIKYYKKDACCGDVTLSDNASLGLNNDPEVYNYVCAENITVQSGVQLQNGQNLALIATEEIDLQPGSEISTGAYFTTRIQPEVIPCCDIVLIGERPNVFTPNGDGVNDNYCIQASGATSYTVTVTTSPWNVPFFSGSGSIAPGQTLICVWDGAGIESGDVYNVLIELRNACTQGQGILIGGYVHAFKSAPIEPHVIPNGAQFVRGVEFDPLLGGGLDTTALAHADTSVPSWDFTLTPNPSKGETVLVLDTEMTVASADVNVQGILGNEVRFTTEMTNSGVRLRLMNAQEGIYLVSVYHQGVRRSHALVVNGQLE